MELNFKTIEDEIKRQWSEEKIYEVKEDFSKPKYYVLDMFPYPSGAGLHVGHPLGYIASDIVARYKRLKGFNVLHPMGYDSFGLPAEQYAIQTGQHPKITTEENIKRYREQMDKIGFSFDWSREVRTSNPDFYKWTQWIFLQIFNSWYNKKTDRAEKISELISEFENNGNKNVSAACSETKLFSADDWKNFSEKEKQETLMNYRLTYLSEAYVNWCPQMGTVLANDEVKDGVSERGGYPVERKLMKQWSMRITAYAERLLSGLNEIDWSDSAKEAQRNWIGKSEGCSIEFKIENANSTVEVFTTRPDTIFGATYLTLSPEHELIEKITTNEFREAVNTYVNYAKNKSERERMIEKKISGQFTGAFAIHPFTNEKIPIWIGEYVLAGYGTGAVMAVPAHDERDWNFAKHFNLLMKEVVKGGNVSAEAFEGEGENFNSDFLDGLKTAEAKKKIISEIENCGIGKGKINYKMRDAVFGRQRYWGEPIPIFYKPARCADGSFSAGGDEIPYAVDEKDLPIILPEVDKYLPTESGEPPLARADFKYNGFELEKTTMPGWAGSSWYFLRYMNPENKNEFAAAENLNYWKQIDLYVGGSEHATGHLLYFRFWTKFLKDLGFISIDEPAKKLVNQGMIQGISKKIVVTKSYFFNDEFGDTSKGFYLHVGDKDVNLPDEKYFTQIYLSADIVERDFFHNNPTGSGFLKNVPINLVKETVLDCEEFVNWFPSEQKAIFINHDSIYYDGKYFDLDWKKIEKTNFTFVTVSEVEKMSKSKYNVVNPDEIIEKYGADCFRMYEMFLGPVELSKPWDTKGIDGVSRFLRKFWKLFFDEAGNKTWNDEEAIDAELKILHRTIKKIEDDTEKLSFNTSVSALMISVNELSDLDCHKKIILKDLLVLMSPMAPFITDYLWRQIGESGSVITAAYPVFNPTLVKENNFEYPVSVNGKVRTKINFPLELSQMEIEKEILSLELIQKWMEGKPMKKFIFVKGRMINVVV